MRECVRERVICKDATQTNFNHLCMISVTASRRIWAWHSRAAGIRPPLVRGPSLLRGACRSGRPAAGQFLRIRRDKWPSITPNNDQDFSSRSSNQQRRHSSRKMVILILTSSSARKKQIKRIKFVLTMNR